MVVTWSQLLNHDWEICYRRYTPPTKDNPRGQWAETVRLTKNPGSDFHVVGATDSAGTVWLAWQAWRDDNFEILRRRPGRTATPGRSRGPSPTARPTTGARPSPRTRNGRRVRRLGHLRQGQFRRQAARRRPGRPDRRRRRVARFEARPSLACDGKDRVWIAYEEGDEQWGKDFAHEAAVSRTSAWRRTSASPCTSTARSR